MKVTFTDKWAARKGQEAEVTEAAGKRLVDTGFATVGSDDAAGEASDEAKPAAKKAAKKAVKKS